MKQLMAANWKMHKTVDEARQTAIDLASALEGKLPADREVLIFPAFGGIAAVAESLAGKPGMAVGGQNFYPAEKGAFTGEMSPGMLLDLGCEYALTGHSERRHVLGESNEFVGQKTAFALAAGLKVVLCVGETLEEREAGEVEQVLEKQLSVGLAGIPADLDPSRLAIAYEPVWAIGTGKVAQTSDIAEAHNFLRARLEAKMPGRGGLVRILYGGSVKPDNTKSIISLDNVNGVLVGGASLQAKSFADIVTA